MKTKGKPEILIFYQLKNKKSQQMHIAEPIIKIILALGAGFLLIWAVILMISRFS